MKLKSHKAEINNSGTYHYITFIDRYVFAIHRGSKGGDNWVVSSLKDLGSIPTDNYIKTNIWFGKTKKEVLNELYDVVKQKPVGYFHNVLETAQ